MKLAIMQPYFFPYIGYFQLIHAVDQFVVYDDVNFIKQGWIARNKILLNGDEFMISLQLNGASSYKHINEINVGGNAEKLVKTIQQAYRKAPFFSECFPVFEGVLRSSEDNLGRFLFHLIRSVSQYLDIQTPLILSSELPKDCNLKGQDKVVHICEVLGAHTYFNVAGGKELYSKEFFREHGIELKFINSKPIIYKQFVDPFVPWLSIIDVMMFNPVGSIHNMLERYELS